MRELTWTPQTSYDASEPRWESLKGFLPVSPQVANFLGSVRIFSPASGRAPSTMYRSDNLEPGQIDDLYRSLCACPGRTRRAGQGRITEGEQSVIA